MSGQERSRSPIGVALVLGAGGPVGQAYHAGVLQALAEACGWDPCRADLIVGTSAGAQVGALLRGGVTACELYAYATRAGSATDGAAPAFAWPVRRTAAPRRARRQWPGSPAYLGRILRRPWLLRPGRLLAAMLPEGFDDDRLPSQALARLHGARWPAQPLWIPAVAIDSGDRVIFGRPGAPAVDVGIAVRCSSAVPGLRRPVVVGRERYVDGAIASATHADVIAGQYSSSVRALVLSPLSRFAPMRLLVRRELRALARRGIVAVALEPDREVAAAMGWNPMDARHAPRVAELAYTSTLGRLRDDDAGPLRHWLTSPTTA